MTNLSNLSNIKGVLPLTNLKNAIKYENPTHQSYNPAKERIERLQHSNSHYGDKEKIILDNKRKYEDIKQSISDELDTQDITPKTKHIKLRNRIDDKFKKGELPYISPYTGPHIKIGPNI